MISPTYIFFDLQEKFFTDLATFDLFFTAQSDCINWLNWLKIDLFQLTPSSPLLHSHYFYLFSNESINLPLFNNIENLTSIYHYSIPNVKLNYPEPFVASASSMHSDLWFVHILIYQYWVWFVFSFIIIFFFLTFVCIVRWCNMRVRPRRETRGVSRSKCGDLITACVPVSWAASIIINESTDAIDYYDGFGTTELVIGIRAYQWGWEYYYPKDLDLNYNINKNYSIFVGNSLKYNFSSDLNLKTNNLWKFYQNKQTDAIITPAHLVWLSSDIHSLINFSNFNDVGLNTIYEINSFKKIKFFSKTNNIHIQHLPSPLHSSYSYINKIYNHPTTLYSSINYGLKRQHTSAANQLNYNGLTPLNHHSNRIFMYYNHYRSKLFNTDLFDFSNSSIFNNTSYSPILETFWLTVLNLSKFTIKFDSVNRFINNRENFLNFNNDTDRKNLLYPGKNLLPTVLKKNYYTNKVFFTHLSSLNYFSNTPIELFNKSSQIRKNYNIFSNNQNILTNSKFIRKYLTIKPQHNHQNLVNNLNQLKDYHENFFLSSTSQPFIFNLYNGDFFNSAITYKLSINKLFFDYPHSPISTNNPLFSPINFDSSKTSLIEEIPTIFQGKEENLPDYLTSAYWNFFWFNMPTSKRLNNNLFFFSNNNKFYLPLFSQYYDYDFRNWQSIELAEDNFWELSFPINSFDEYQNMRNEFYSFNVSKKLFKFFSALNKLNKFSNNVISAPTSINNNLISSISFYPIFNDDLFHPSLPTLDLWYILSNSNNYFNIDDTYENYKTNFPLLNQNNVTSFQHLTVHNPVIHTFNVFNTFRSDYEDFSWFFDENNYIKTNNQLKNLFSVSRMSYNYQLRNTIKSSIVTFNALQKVFHTRFDEGRSHSKLEDLSQSYYKQPFITSSRIRYEKLIGKNKDNFFKINYYYTSPNRNFIFNSQLNTALNCYFFDFPFLVAHKSDASRYLWFDWFSKWGLIDVQPASASKYALYGMPYFNKYFDFNSQQNDLLTETESYFSRLGRARKNYLLNWGNSPYLFVKNIIWNPHSVINNFIINNVPLIIQLNYLLNAFEWYWHSTSSTTNYLFLPANSNTTSYAKTNSKPITLINLYYNSIVQLADILTRREWFYRELFINSNRMSGLPAYFTATPNHPLFDEIKSAFVFSDSNLVNNEYSKEIYFNSLNFFNYSTFKFLFYDWKFLNFFYSYLYNQQSLPPHNDVLVKNQYRPMRKGIGNMLRLHASGAIALPIEIRLQILASSKDVIHSWAIPSAGIKIDCIPGYSSHKVMIFLVSGIFWGQCMEICGRYHHWMPIVVYFMKRDLFFLWCTHFVFLSGSNNVWSINERQFTNYIQPVSYTKSSWIQEVFI